MSPEWREELWFSCGQVNWDNKQRSCGQVLPEARSFMISKVTEGKKKEDVNFYCVPVVFFLLTLAPKLIPSRRQDTHSKLFYKVKSRTELIPLKFCHVPLEVSRNVIPNHCSNFSSSVSLPFPPSLSLLLLLLILHNYSPYYATYSICTSFIFRDKYVPKQEVWNGHLGWWSRMRKNVFKLKGSGGVVIVVTYSCLQRTVLPVHCHSMLWNKHPSLQLSTYPACLSI